MFTSFKIYVLSIYFIALFYTAVCDIRATPHELSIKLNEKDVFIVEIRNNTKETTLHLTVQHPSILQINNSVIEIRATDSEANVPIEIEAVGAGHSEIRANDTISSANVSQVYVVVTVYKNAALETFSVVIGWIYFVAWAVSFYPQIYINWKRKSVVGLNFDFVVLNIVGFILYSVFNLGLYAIPEIEDEYFNRHPTGLNPVKINDIVFSVHAAFATAITIFQCFIYERNNQTVSITARLILGIFAAFILISAIISACGILHWLDFLYYCSYVKLTITLIKYVPQAFMNFKRKSTIGWSIGNIFLDFTGGLLSMLQMIVDSYNYDDWKSIFGDPTKFGLGLFSVAFDILFIIQHYVLYRHSSYEEN